VLLLQMKYQQVSKYEDKRQTARPSAPLALHGGKSV
jgi:hypothetical protein